MSFLFRAFVLSLFLGLASIANAAPVTFYFSFNGSGITSTGAITGSLNGTGYLVSTIIGQYNGAPITGVLAAGSYQDNDNTVLPTEPYLDFSGVAFSVGGSNYNLFYDNGANNCESVPGYYVYFGQSASSPTCGPTVNAPVTLSVTQTPEPSGVWLIGLGLFGAMRRYRAIRPVQD